MLTGGEFEYLQQCFLWIHVSLIALMSHFNIEKHLFNSRQILSSTVDY